MLAALLKEILRNVMKLFIFSSLSYHFIQIEGALGKMFLTGTRIVLYSAPIYLQELQIQSHSSFENI